MKPNLTTRNKLNPILAQYLKETDTDEIVDRAIELATIHTHYKADCEKARFCSFYTEKEVKADKRPSHPYILVEPGTVYESFRFERALQAARLS